MMTFVSTAWSSARGMMAYKLAARFLADYYLPLIDPKEFLKQIKKVPILLMEINMTRIYGSHPPSISPTKW
jgi:hypothetical protein